MKVRSGNNVHKLGLRSSSLPRVIRVHPRFFIPNWGRIIFTEKILLKIRFLRANPACLVEGMEDDLSITRLSKVVALWIGTTTVLEVGLMINRCLITHVGSKYKGGMSRGKN